MIIRTPCSLDVGAFGSVQTAQIRFFVVLQNKLIFSGYPQYITHDPTSIILLKKIEIWGIPQIPRYLGSQNLRVFGKFRLQRNFIQSRNKPPSDSPRNLENSPDSQVMGFHKCLDIWEISQISRHYKNILQSKNKPPFSEKFGKFLRFLGISGIPQGI